MKWFNKKKTDDKKPVESKTIFIDKINKIIDEMDLRDENEIIVDEDDYNKIVIELKNNSWFYDNSYNTGKFTWKGTNVYIVNKNPYKSKKVSIDFNTKM